MATVGSVIEIGGAVSSVLDTVGAGMAVNVGKVATVAAAFLQMVLSCN